MDLGLQGKVILVAGMGPVGEAVARRLLEEGAFPCVLEGVAGDRYSLTADLDDPAACIRIIKIIRDHFGHIDGLVDLGGDHRSVVSMSFPYLEETNGAIVQVVPADEKLNLPESLGTKVRVSVVLVKDHPDQPTRWERVMGFGTRRPPSMTRERIAAMVVSLFSDSGRDQVGEGSTQERFFHV